MVSESSSKALGYKAVRNAVYAQLAAFFAKFTQEHIYFHGNVNINLDHWVC